jgi:hypothetical protein
MLTRAILVLLLVLPAGALAQKPASHTVRAAPSELERKLEAYGYTHGRLLELGRAQEREGKLGAAIASFERGLLLAPRDHELKEALSEARAEAGVAQERLSLLERCIFAASSREWAFAGLCGAILLALGTLAWAADKRARRGAQGAAALGAIVLACAAGAYHTRASHLTVAFAGRKSVAARLSPFATAEPAFTLTAGQAVEPAQKHGEYVHVTNEEGRGGWVKASELIPLVPERSVGS